MLALSLARIGWRLTHRPPPLPATLAPWRAASSRVVHAAFYVLMIALPLTGWLRTSPNAYPFSWFGLFDVPKFPIERGSAEAAAAAAAHEAFGWAMLLLALLHIAAALHHRFVLRDRVFARMAPSPLRR